LAYEIKLTVLPSLLIAGTTLSPFDGAGATPLGWLARTVDAMQVEVVVDVKPWHVLRTKTFSMPFAIFEARFEDFVANATNCPV
jgi:hypothetical protein